MGDVSFFLFFYYLYLFILIIGCCKLSFLIFLHAILNAHSCNQYLSMLAILFHFQYSLLWCSGYSTFYSPICIIMVILSRNLLVHFKCPFIYWTFLHFSSSILFVFFWGGGHLFSLLSLFPFRAKTPKVASDHASFTRWIYYF